MVHWLVQYGAKDRHIETALATLFSLLVSLFFIFYTGFLKDIPSLESVVSSDYISDILLAVFRTACAILSLITLSWIVFDPKGAPDNPLYFKDRKNHPRHSKGFTRLAAFTMWHFGLFGISFAISAACSWIHLSGGDVPEWMLIASPALFATTYACAILVTFVVSYHIIGDTIKNKYSLDKLFYWYEIVMHNFNVVLLGIAIILNNFEVDWRYFALRIIFGIMYTIWARIYASVAGVYIYSFLDPRLNGAPIIHVILLTIIVVSFVFVKFLELISDWSIIAGIITITILNVMITTFKQPETDY